MKKALVVDWLDKYGGAEKVIQALEKCIGFNEVHALVNIMKASELQLIFPKKQPVKTTVLQNLGSKFRLFFPLFFREINNLEIGKDVGLIISSSHCIAKGVQKSHPNQVHISYFQAPNSNYIWQDAPLYFKRFYPLIRWVLPVFRRMDIKDSKHPDFIICNSNYVKTWVKNTYKREADVIYPPVNLERFPLKIEKQDFYVIAGRIAAIKRFDLVIEAFNKNNRPLVVIGDGEELSRLKALAKTPKIVFLGFQDSEVLSQRLQDARAFIQMGVEGFGIAAIEAQSCGTPVICYEKGGVVETVVNGKTGVFFKEQTIMALNNGISEFEQQQFDAEEIHLHAQQFSEESFCKNIQEYINERVY